MPKFDDSLPTETLRDKFAMAAPLSFIEAENTLFAVNARNEVRDGRGYISKPTEEEILTYLVKISYIYADAMMAMRDKSKKE